MSFGDFSRLRFLRCFNIVSSFFFFLIRRLNKTLFRNRGVYKFDRKKKKKCPPVCTRTKRKIYLFETSVGARIEEVGAQLAQYIYVFFFFVIVPLIIIAIETRKTTHVPSFSFYK